MYQRLINGIPEYDTKSYHCRCLMILKLQPPEDPVVLTLISGQVVQPQPAAGRRRRAEASVRVVHQDQDQVHPGERGGLP